MITVTNGTPIAVESLAAESKMAVATPRSFVGNQ